MAQLRYGRHSTNAHLIFNFDSSGNWPEAEILI